MNRGCLDCWSLFDAKLRPSYCLGPAWAGLGRTWAALMTDCTQLCTADDIVWCLACSVDTSSAVPALINPCFRGPVKAAIRKIVVLCGCALYCDDFAAPGLVLARFSDDGGAR